MSKTVITFLFDEGQIFQESWELTDNYSESLSARLKRISNARLPLLASCVRIVQVKAKGHPLERVDLRGIGGAYAHARDALKLMNDDRSTSIFLRGVPGEVYARHELTPKGIAAFGTFSKTLNECGAVIIRHGDAIPITKLWPSHATLYSYKKDKKATLRKLISILGDEEAQRVWQGLKKKREDQWQPAATPS